VVLLVLLDFVVCHPTEIKEREIRWEGWANKILGPEFCNWYQKLGGRHERLTRR
jgi:hypothetical protein